MTTKRNKKASRKASKASRKASTKRSTQGTTTKRKGFRGYQGTSTALNVSEYWEHLFKAQPEAMLTDVQVADAVAAEFPNAKRPTDGDVMLYRNRYNNGRLSHQDGTKPKVRIRQYVACPHCAGGVGVPMWGEKNGRISAPARKTASVKKKVSGKKKTKAKVSRKNKS